MKEIGIVGYGNFGQFMAAHLAPYFKVSVYDARVPIVKGMKNITIVDLDTVVQKPIVILAVPVQNMETVLSQTRMLFTPDALVVDVCSVKIKPARLMQELLPPNVSIIGLHPLFGPQSGKNGIVGLPIVMCPIRTSNPEAMRSFLQSELGLRVIVKTPEEHDMQMAFVQGLTHLIGRAAAKLDIPDLDLKTSAYQKLLDIKELLGGDSDALFASIENENPYAGKVRRSFLSEIEKLQAGLDAGDMI